MEVPQVSLKQDVDNFTVARESNVDYKSKILDLMEIKVDPVKLEPGSYEAESNNLYQELKLSEEEAKIIGYNDEHMLDCSLQEILFSQDQAITLEGSQEMNGIVKTEDTVDVKWEIKNEELNIKDEKLVTDEEYKYTEIKPEGSKEIDGVENIKDPLDEKCEIVNEELNIKADENGTDEEYRLYEISSTQQQDSEVKLGKSENLGKIKNIEEYVEVKWAIEKEVQDKMEEENVTCEEQRMPENHQLKNREKLIGVPAQAAVMCIEEGSLTDKAAVKYNISISTHKRYRNRETEGMEVPKRAGPIKKTTFTAQQTKDFVKLLTECDRRGIRLTLTQVQKLVFQFAEENEIDHGFCRETKTADANWSRTFSVLNKLNVRNPGTSSIFSHNQLAVQFLTILRDVRREFNFKPDRIYNAGDINLFLIAPDKQMVSAERNRTTTLVCAVNAVGSYVPPFFVFALHKMKRGLLEGCPPGSKGIARPAGWMTPESFLAFLKHFAKYAKPSIDDPVLLLVDCRSSHVSLLVLNFCRDNGIILTCFPSHTELWRTFYGPLKEYYHSDRVTCERNLLPLLAKAYCEAARNNAVRGFKESGIEPFNSLIFGVDVLSAVTTGNDGSPEVAGSLNLDWDIDDEDSVAKKKKLVKSK